jgi:hypothetical protein
MVLEALTVAFCSPRGRKMPATIAMTAKQMIPMIRPRLDGSSGGAEKMTSSSAVSLWDASGCVEN